MHSLILPPDKKVFWASDFHLGAPNLQESKLRERKIINWINAIQNEAQMVFLLGDIFDFWFEYKKVIPKGFVRLQSKIASLVDSGVTVYFFVGNHDMWMKKYFEEELGVSIFHHPISLLINDMKFHMGHGDGLGKGDKKYKLLKKVFKNRAAWWFFERLHPNLGMSLAHYWSSKSRINNHIKEDHFLGDDEWILGYCKEIEAQTHHDYYIFGHRHLPIDVPVSVNSHYINLGEWISHCTYAVFDGKQVRLLHYTDPS